MSKTVDSRVVEMRFDNQNFESNVKTSMSTIDKLKQALKFDGVGKGFDNISSAAKNCNLNPLSAAVQTVGMKFSALQVMATTALANITNSAVNAGKQIVSALTIDPIKSGFQEYETQINAIQTVLANTESKGTTLGDVNAALDELNKYADKTIYNFTEMTKNIGTFTAAGVDLETSVSSIKGIANLAAISGSTSQQASTAMYQLSQALAAGRVSLMDWNSVVNAGMGGEVFQNALKRTARNMGIAVDEIIATYGSFRESLSREKWLTTDVLTETLSQIAGAYSEEDLLAKGYTNDQTAEILKLAKTGEEAATKVKTFTQLIDTTKEALQSGWTQSWENIIGDFEGAKTFWTGISDKLNNAIGSSADNRNNFLEKALDSNYDKLVKGLNEVGISTNDFQEKVKESAKALGYTDEQIAKITSDFGSFEAGVKSGAIAVSAVKDAIVKLTSESADLSLVKDDLAKGRTGEDVRQIQKALKDLGYDLGEFGEQADGLDGKLGSFTETAIKAFQEANGLKVTGIVDEETLSALDKASTKTKTLKSDIMDLASAITEKGGRDLLHESLGNILNFVLTLKDTIGQAFRDIFDFKPEGLFNAIKGFNDFTKTLKMSEDTIDEVKRSFKGLFAIIDIIGTLSGSVVKYAFKGLSAILSNFNLDILGFTANLGDGLVALRDWVDAHDVVGMVIEKIGTVIGWTIQKLGEFIALLKESPEVQAAISKMGEGFAKIFSGLKDYFSGGLTKFTEFIERVKQMDSISLENIVAAFKDFKDNVLGYFFDFDFAGVFDKIKNKISAFFDSIRASIPTIGNAFDWVIEKGKAFVSFIQDALPSAIAIAVSAITAIGVYKLGKGLFNLTETLLSPLELLDTIGDSLRSIAKTMKFKMIGEAVKSFATAILMLVGAIALLVKLQENGNIGLMWSAVGAIVALMTVLGLLSFAMSKMPLTDSVKFFGLAAAVVALAGSLFILVECINKLRGMDVTETLINAGILLGMVTILGAIAGMLGYFDSGVISGAMGLLAMAIALRLLVGVLGAMSGVSLDTIINALPAFIAIISSIIALIAATNMAGKYASQAGGAILAIGVALNLMIFAFKILGKMKPEEILAAIPGLITIMGMVATLMAASYLAGVHAFKAGGMILAISIALNLIVFAVKQIAKINESDIDKSKNIIAGIMELFAALIMVSNFSGANAHKAGLMILMLSASLMMIVGAIAIIKNLKEDGLWRAVGIIAILETLFGALIGVSHFAGNGFSTIIALTACIVALTGALAALTALDSGELKTATKSLSMIMGAFAALIGVTKLISKELKLTGLLKTLVPLILVVGGLATILTILSKLNVGNTKEISESISLLMLSLAASCAMISLAGGKAAAATGAMYALTGVVAGMAAILGYLDGMEIAANLQTVAGLSILLLSLSAACVILSAIGSAGGYALAGVGVLGVLILEIIGIFALLGKIEEWDPTVLENSIKSLSKIGSAIGEFFGSIVSSFGDAATRSLPDIGTRLSSFMRNIQPFLENAKNIPADITAKVGLLSASIVALSGAEFVAAITNLASTFTGGGAFSNISSGLNNLGDGMVGFYSKIEGVNKTALVTGTEAVKAFAGLMAVAPPEGGLLDWLLGKKDLSSFADGISDFGDALAGFAEACSDLTDDSVAKMELGAKAGKALADLANAIPSTDGVLQKIIGYKDFEGFSEAIEVFGRAMVSYAGSISTLTEDDITKMEWMVDAGTALKDLATALPESGGWRQKILGDQDLAKFGTQIVAFGGYLMSYVSSISDFTEDDADKIANTANASTKLADLVKSLPESGGWRQKILGDNDLASFGSSLSTFIVGLRSFLIQAREIKDDDISAIPMVGDAIDAVKTVLEKVPKSGGWGSAIFGSANTNTFGTGLSAVANGIKDFIAIAKTIDESTPATIAATSESVDELVTIANSITENVDSGSLMSCVTQLSELGTLIVGLANQDYSGLTSLKDSLNAFGKDSLTSFIDAFTTGGTEAVTAVNTFLTMIETAFTAAEPNFEVAGKTLVSSVGTGLSDGSGDVVSAAQQLGISAATALSGCSSEFSIAGASCASGFAAGISTNTFEAVAAASAMAEAALAAAEAKLGINSPSKEFAKDGKFSALGYIKGLESNLSNVYNAAYNVGDTAKRGLGNAISKIQNLIESGIDTQPTIRPVLDISDVAAGVGSINGMLGINPSVSTLANVRRISSGMNKGQNGGTDDMASAIRELIDTVSNKPSNVYNIDGVTYDDGTNVSNAVKTLIRAAKIERRT